MTVTILGAVSAAIWVYLIAFRGGFWRVPTGARPAPLPLVSPRSVIAVIPARDEADVIGRAVASLLAQRYEGSLEVIVIDDHSGDGTAAAAIEAAAAIGSAERLTVTASAPLAAGCRRGARGRVGDKARRVEFEEEEDEGRDQQPLQ